MTHHPALAPLSIAASTSGAGFFAQLLSTNTNLNLGEALTVFVFVAGLVWHLSRKLQKIEDDIIGITKEVEQLRQCVEDSRPCQKRSD